MEIVRYMEVTRAKLPMGRDNKNRGVSRLTRGPSSKPWDLKYIKLKSNNSYSMIMKEENSYKVSPHQVKNLKTTQIMKAENITWL